MIGKNISAEGGSTVVGGDNHAPITNINLQIECGINQKLPSHLGHVIAKFAANGLEHYGEDIHRNLPPEVITKIQHNHLNEEHRILKDFRKHSGELERAYQGVEQSNSDARYLVRRKTGVVYDEQLAKANNQKFTTPEAKLDFVRTNAEMLLNATINALLDDYTYSAGATVEQEAAHLAISLIVADAVIECEVLERP